MRWPWQKKQEIWELSKIQKNGVGIGTRQLLRGLKPRPTHPHLLYVTRTFEGRPMPTPQEMRDFKVFDDQLTSELEKMEAILVAVMMIDGKRDWIVYAKDGQASAQVLYSRLEGVQIEHQPDLTWSQYKDLVGMPQRKQ